MSESEKAEIRTMLRRIEALLGESIMEPKKLSEEQEAVLVIAHRVRSDYAAFAIGGKSHKDCMTELRAHWDRRDEQINNYLKGKGSKCLRGLKPIPRASKIFVMVKNNVMPEWIRDLAKQGRG